MGRITYLIIGLAFALNVIFCEVIFAVTGGWLHWLCLVLGILCVPFALFYLCVFAVDKLEPRNQRKK